MLRASIQLLKRKEVGVDSMVENALTTSRAKLEALAPVAMAPIRHHVFVCTGKSCATEASADVKKAFEYELLARGILFGKEKKGKNPRGSVIVTECASVGFCAIGPAVMVYPDGIWYAQVSTEDVAEIVEYHLLNGRVVERLALLKLPAEGKSVSPQGDRSPKWEA